MIYRHIIYYYHDNVKYNYVSNIQLQELLPGYRLQSTGNQPEGWYQ